MPYLRFYEGLRFEGGLEVSGERTKGDLARLIKEYLYIAFPEHSMQDLRGISEGLAKTILRPKGDICKVVNNHERLLRYLNVLLNTDFSKSDATEIREALARMEKEEK